jgi:hypothetical protein
MDRALIVKKPRIDLILSGEKTWEMRSKPTKITGWIGLIEQGTGLIVGRAFLTSGWIRPSKQELIDNHSKHLVDDTDILERWCYAWEIERAERFDKPIKYKHPKGAVVWVKLCVRLC